MIHVERRTGRVFPNYLQLHSHGFMIEERNEYKRLPGFFVLFLSDTLKMLLQCMAHLTNLFCLIAS